MGNQIETKAANRRGAHRRKPRGSVKIECRKGALGLGANLAGPVLDVSETGLRIILTAPLDLQTEVEVIISGYGMKEAVKRLGTVRWQLKLEAGPFCTGIEFQKRLVYRDWQNVASPS